MRLRPPPTLALLPLLALACDDDTGPVTEPPPVVYESARFALTDFAETPEALVASLLDRLEAELDRVAALLPEFQAPPVPVSMHIQAGHGIPFVTVGQNRLSQWREDLAPEYFAHQLAHLHTRYQRTAFIEEGLAVWVSEELRASDEGPNPFRLQAPHGWVALYRQHGSLISLFTALRADNLGYDYEGSSPDASAWQLFNQAGSFTRWLMDVHGRATWFTFYESANIGTTLGLDTPDIEQAWLAHADSVVPDPLPCEEGVGTVGPRETFWCARAVGN